MSILIDWIGIRMEIILCYENQEINDLLLRPSGTSSKIEEEISPLYFREGLGESNLNIKKPACHPECNEGSGRFFDLKIIPEFVLPH